jgi:hypothetical protein
MDRILKIKDEYQGTNISTSIPGSGYKVKIKEGISQNYMNNLYNLGLTQYFDVVTSVSLVDDTIDVIEDTPTAIFDGLFDITPKPEVTPTPNVKKKNVDVNHKDNGFFN